MTFLAVIVALVLIAVFWRPLMGLALVAVAVVGVLLAWGAVDRHIKEARKRGNWTLTVEVYGKKPMAFTKLATREVCEAKLDGILEATRRTYSEREAWRVSGWCD